MGTMEKKICMNCDIKISGMAIIDGRYPSFFQPMDFCSFKCVEAYWPKTIFGQPTNIDTHAKRANNKY